MSVMKKWKFVNIVIDGQPVNVNGVNPWDYEWHLMDEEPIMVPHPSYPNQTHKMWIYEIKTDTKIVMFAAGEFSNCVWGFYINSSE